MLPREETQTTEVEDTKFLNLLTAPETKISKAKTWRVNSKKNGPFLDTNLPPGLQKPNRLEDLPKTMMVQLAQRMSEAGRTHSNSTNTLSGQPRQRAGSKTKAAATRNLPANTTVVTTITGTIITSVLIIIIIQADTTKIIIAIRITTITTHITIVVAKIPITITTITISTTMHRTDLAITMLRSVGMTSDTTVPKNGRTEIKIEQVIGSIRTITIPKVINETSIINIGEFRIYKIYSFNKYINYNPVTIYFII